MSPGFASDTVQKGNDRLIRLTPIPPLPAKSDKSCLLIYGWAGAWRSCMMNVNANPVQVMPGIH